MSNNTLSSFNKFFLCELPSYLKELTKLYVEGFSEKVKNIINKNQSIESNSAKNRDDLRGYEAYSHLVDVYFNDVEGERGNCDEAKVYYEAYIRLSKDFSQDEITIKMIKDMVDTIYTERSNQKKNTD